MKTNDNILNINGGCINSDMLLKYIKGELSALERNRIERHLASCEMCSDELEGLSLLINPEQIVGIENELNQRVDAVVVDNEKAKPLWGLYLRIAASILLLIGISSIVYFTVYNTPQTTMISEDQAFVIEEPSPVFESNKPVESKTSEGIPKMENQKLAYSEASGMSAAKTKVEKEIIPEEQKYVAPVVVDSVSVNEDVLCDEVAELVVMVNLDSLNLTGGIAVAEKQIVSEFNAPVKAASAEKKELLSQGNASSRITIRGSSSVNYNSRTIMALSQYRIGNYKLALSSFSEIDNMYPGIDSIQFYISMSRYKLDLFNESVKGFEKLTQNRNSSFFSDAQWYYALNLIKLGKINKAKSVLKSIIDSNSKYKDDAINKLDKIKN